MKQRRNTLYTKNIDYTLVEEYLDQIMTDEPVAVTYIIKKCNHRFQTNREYRAASISDAVKTYYAERYGGAERIRNYLVSMSNNTRDVSDETRMKMSHSQTGNHNRLGKYKYRANISLQ